MKPTTLVKRRSIAKVWREARQEQGQAAVEFGMVSLTLLLFFVGALDLGRAVYYYDLLANAARDGARYASVLQGSGWTIDGNVPGSYTTTVPYARTSTIVGAAVGRTVGMDPAALRVTISAPMGTISGLQLPVTVATQYAYRPIAATLLGVGTITITAQSTMRIW